jgi:hypothetical protein
VDTEPAVLGPSTCQQLKPARAAPSRGQLHNQVDVNIARLPKKTLSRTFRLPIIATATASRIPKNLQPLSIDGI